VLILLFSSWLGWVRFWQGKWYLNLFLVFESFCPKSVVFQSFSLVNIINMTKGLMQVVCLQPYDQPVLKRRLGSGPFDLTIRTAPNKPSLFVDSTT
jgi:hypothetical protein